MTLIRPESGEQSPEQVLEDAQKQFDRTREALEGLIQKIQAGKVVPAAESTSAVREMGRAKQTLFDERKKIEEQLRRDAGVHNAYALDLGAARLEIRRRMACLRAAGEDRAVSE